jgi:hypothetical protein
MQWKGLSQSMSEQGDGLHDGLDPSALGYAELLSAVRQFHDIAMLWHTEEPVESPDRRGTAGGALHLHALNFALWHHEDAVRRPGAGDREVARRKRCIDDVNARRNEAIEAVDANLLNRIELNPNAPLHTETPGTIVDRLSVLALRIVHTNQSDARLVVLDEQYGDLFHGLEQFLARIQAGEARFKLYRQFKSAAPRNYCDLFEGRDA